MDYKASTNISSSRSDAEEAADETSAAAISAASPKKDAGVQTGIHVKYFIVLFHFQSEDT